jgi:hypothetical protein
MSFLRELWISLAQSIRDALVEVVKLEGGQSAASLKALDVYSSSGNLQRASSAFVGNLEDYVHYRDITGSRDEGIAHRKLAFSTDYMADAIDTFVCVSQKLHVPPGVNESEGPFFPLIVETERGTTNRLTSAINDGSSTLDGCRVILARAKENHEGLRNSLTHLRGVIHDKFDFSVSVSD